MIYSYNDDDNNVIYDMPDDEFDKHCSEISEWPNSTKYGLTTVESYKEGIGYAEFVEPENLPQEKKENRDFVKGYNEKRLELGKSEIPMPEQKRKQFVEIKNADNINVFYYSVSSYSS